MPVDPGLIAMFLGATLAICLAPGPDMLFILASSMGQGPRAGIVAAVGMAAGMLGHTLIAAVGLSALFLAVPFAFDFVHLAAAAYLLWLAVAALRAPAFAGDLAAAPPKPLALVFRRATITNLLNPKIALFYLAFLPQFIDPARGSPTAQLLLQATLLILVGLVVDGAIGVASGHLGRRLVRHRTVARTLRWLPPGIYAGLALRLILDSRR